MATTNFPKTWTLVAKNAEKKASLARQQEEAYRHLAVACGRLLAEAQGEGFTAAADTLMDEMRRLTAATNEYREAAEAFEAEAAEYRARAQA